MGQIKNTIKLVDEMSPVLIKIKETAAKIAPELEVLKPIFEDLKAMSEAVGGAIEKVTENVKDLKDHSKLMLENFIEGREAIAEATEAVEQHAKGIDKVAKSTDRASQSNERMMGGMGQMASGLSRILGQVGLLPKEFVRTTMAVGQLRRGVSGTIPVLAQFTAALGPITLIATTGMAVANIFQMWRREVDETLPSFDELISRSDKLLNESRDLETSLYKNIRLMEELNQVGASDKFINRMEMENEQIQRQIAALEVRAGMQRYEARRSAHEEASKLFGDMFGLENIFDMPEVIRLNREYYYELKELGDGLLTTLQRENVRILEQLQGEMHESLNENIGYIMQWANVLRDSTIPEQREMSEMLDRLTDKFTETNYAVRRSEEGLARYSDEAKNYLAIIERMMEKEQARADAVASVNRHLVRSYRDTYAAAESMREAHYALTHAMQGTYSEHMSQLDAFNRTMGLAPEYLQFLFDQHGRLLDVEDAVYAVTQAQIELLGARQANALLDMVGMWDSEGNALGFYTSALDDATSSAWGLVDARLALLRAAEHERVMSESYERLRAQGMSSLDIQQYVNFRVDYAARGTERRIDALRGMTTDAQRTARERGTTRINPMYVSDTSTHDFLREFINIREDVARRDYMTGAFQRGMNTINMGGYTYAPQIYPTELSAQARREIATEGALQSAALCADMLEDAYDGYLG